MKRWNKATAATLGNLVAQGLGVGLGWEPELVGAVSIVVTTVLVYWVPNVP